MLQQRYLSSFYRKTYTVLFSSGEWDLVLFSDDRQSPLIVINDHRRARWFAEIADHRGLPKDLVEFAEAYNKLNS